jgi:hypothetical protein
MSNVNGKYSLIVIQFPEAAAVLPSSPIADRLWGLPTLLCGENWWLCALWQSGYSLKLTAHPHVVTSLITALHPVLNIPALLPLTLPGSGNSSVLFLFVCQL